MKGIIMEVRAIRDEATYHAMLEIASKLIDLDPSPDSPEGEQLEVIGTLIQAYEIRHWPIESPDPVEAIKFRMEQTGLTVSDMVPYIGPKNRVYEVLNRKRPLTIVMIRRLLTLGIPASSLVGEPLDAKESVAA